jgi:TM2 domain-containing membrane protein YozV
VAGAPESSPRSPRVAAALSLLVPGAGLIYAGRRVDGLVFLILETAYWPLVVNALDVAARGKSVELDVAGGLFVAAALLFVTLHLYQVRRAHVAAQDAEPPNSEEGNR